MKITTAHDVDIRRGDLLTIVGVNRLEKRWLPRFIAWLQRKPRPITGKPVIFRVK